MHSNRKHSHSIWYRLTCLLLVFAMSVAPIALALAEMHESEHAITGDSHFDHHDQTLSALQKNHDNDDANSGLHLLIHASHCCAQVVAVLPSLMMLKLPVITTITRVARVLEHSSFVRVNHFRPPISM
jgi:hypothetical protein